MLTYSAIFDRALGLNPEGVAVDAHDARLTYRELDARAEALAQLLVARGIGERNASSASVFHVPPP